MTDLNELMIDAYEQFKKEHKREPNWNEVGCEMLKISGTGECNK